MESICHSTWISHFLTGSWRNDYQSEDRKQKALGFLPAGESWVVSILAHGNFILDNGACRLVAYYVDRPNEYHSSCWNIFLYVSTLSYTLDVYRRDMAPAKSFLTMHCT